MFKGDCNIGLRDRLITLQKRLVRIITGATKNSHTYPIFYNLGALRVDDLFVHSVRVFSYQAFKGLLPAGMADMIGKNDHGHMTRGARSNFFIQRSDCRSIKSIAPKIWNILSSDLKLSPSVASFKERSKRDLLGPYGSFACSVRGCFLALSTPRWRWFFFPFWWGSPCVPSPFYPPLPHSLIFAFLFVLVFLPGLICSLNLVSL